MIRVGFIINYNYKSWYGGTNVINNLIYCIKKYSNNKIEPVLFLRKSIKKKDLDEFKSIKIVKTNIFDHNLFFRIWYKIIIILKGRYLPFELFFKKNNNTIISHINAFAYNFLTGKKSSIKCISWITDFQHVHFPRYFTIKNIILRNLNIFLCQKHSSKILLSSYDAQNDLKKISKTAFEKSVVSQFYYKFDKKKDIINLSELKKKYDIKNFFFFISNQYWRHKNYEVILKSLFYLKKKNKIKNILILSTGYNNDLRNKNYFNEIMTLVNNYGLNDNFRYLGLLSYKEVCSLIFYSIALINPSKFEGRNVSVEQARSMGKKIILSNIKVHLEQNPKRAIFFNPYDYKNLSKIILNAFNKYKIKSELKHSRSEVLKNDNNLFKYYKNYEQIINSIIA